MNNFPKFYNKIFDYSLKKSTHVKFIDILKTKNIKNIKNNDMYSSFGYNSSLILYLTKHIYNEFPIRIANRVTDLNNLPFGLSKNHSINKIREWYLTSFLELTEISEPKTENDIIHFKNIINNIYHRHSATLITMSKGIYELKIENKITDINQPLIQQLLNRFHLNRTEIRILLQHYLSLFDTQNNNHFGIINLNTKPYEIINDALENIQFICDKNNIDIILTDIVVTNFDKNIVLPSIDNYLYYVIFELLKNSVQAVIEQQKFNKDYIPSIFIDLCNIDDNYILIKIKDNGIGIKDIDIHKIWFYSFSNYPIEPTNIIEDTDFSSSSPLSGFGYGLPISDIYINFFNSSSNNIKVDSLYKQGTNIYIYLKKYNS